MKSRGAPFDPSEPPGGDFARYVEGLGAPAADASPDAPLPQAGSRRPVGWGPTTPLRRLSAWMIGAGIGLLVAALLFAGGPLADIYLPGMLLLGAGLALRRHLRRR
ncbi:hypothetical protein [Zeimonas arvi]|uniref:Uncharacterized protein n=1 Tax=Zeimonas arvi TaxID=2498847 RepID=A0A5C8NYR6_9BURK|nr:hypothetical protein [Zeimonas arvi]TXL66232.1 hypothetical protein FHP08_09180 [Zeimonas arvi]